MRAAWSAELARSDAPGAGRRLPAALAGERWPGAARDLRLGSVLTMRTNCSQSVGNSLAISPAVKHTKYIMLPLAGRCGVPMSACHGCCKQRLSARLCELCCGQGGSAFCVVYWAPTRESAPCAAVQPHSCNSKLVVCIGQELVTFLILRPQTSFPRAGVDRAARGLPVQLPASAALFTGGSRPQWPWGSSSLPPH